MIIPKHLTLQSNILGSCSNNLYELMMLLRMIDINNPRLSEMNRTLEPKDFEQS